MKRPPSEWPRAPLSETQQRWVATLLEAALRDLSEHLALPLGAVATIDTNRLRWDHPVGLIGFAGKNAAGFVALAAPWALLRATHPVPNASEDELLDWSRELANLLLGSFKHALLRRGVLIEMGLPSTVLGDSVELRTGNPAGVGLVAETGTLGRLTVFLDAAFSPDVVLPEADIEGTLGGLGDVLF